MKKFKRLISLLLAGVMLCGALTGFSVISVAAAEETTANPAETGDAASNELDYLTHIFATPEDKLASMEYMKDNGSFAIYSDEKSGEVAIKNLITGQIIFTNPYDVATTSAAEGVKQEIMSQIIIKYTDNGREKTYNSYVDAALRDQIKVKNIRNGIRVEYTIGREEARRLLPRTIEKSRFDELIKAPLEEYYGVSADVEPAKDDPLYDAWFYLNQFLNYYQLKGKGLLDSDRLKADLVASFPVLETMEYMYVFDPNATSTEIEKFEEILKAACPNYSYEEMDYDHQMTEYEGTDENPPVFKMALEYTLTQDGFTVRLPANGIRFNETKFQLTNISILPYMGAGNNTYDGYTFYPDGSGALFAFEDLVDVGTTSVSSKIYGVDYAYHKLSGTYQQTIRYPVFGVMEETVYYDCLQFDDDGETMTTISGAIYDQVQMAQETGNTATELYSTYSKLINGSDVIQRQESRGYVAIIEEGDALTELVNYHAGVLSPYDTVMMNFNPRPKDSYNIADAISVGQNSEWTVVSSRKYVGNYKIHYIMLTDETIAANKANDLAAKNMTAFEASWLGMAVAYRDYLTEKGILKPLSEEAISGNVPLYIESFGAIETVEKIMSIPVTVEKALTSAQDIITMYEELSAKGVTDINFKLTGYANGGMNNKIAYKLKWEKAVQKAEEGEDVSMQELFDYAANLEDGELNLFPEFEFSYVYGFMDELFDGLTLSKHCVKTIDDRYTSKRLYSATQQKYTGYFELAISPAYFSHFYEELMDHYLEYENVTGISVGSFGNALNSDFDEDEPYNREDSKKFVRTALQYLSGQKNSAGEELEVMVDGGNVYTWEFVDHILGVSLDSSRYIKASYSVPFIGVVLHGYMNFTGSPLNMEGDVNYAKLKAIENGASAYFTLSYRNTQLLKEDTEFSNYYSVRYDIWFDDVVEIYNELNTALGDVQNKVIVDHEFLSGMRVPDADELDTDLLEKFEEVLDYQNNKAEYEVLLKTQAVADARQKISDTEQTAIEFIKTSVENYTGAGGVSDYFMRLSRLGSSFSRTLATYIEASKAYDSILETYHNASEEERVALEKLKSDAENQKNSEFSKLKNVIRLSGQAVVRLENEYNKLVQMLADAEEGLLLISGAENCPQSVIDEAKLQLENARAMKNQSVGIDFNRTAESGAFDSFMNAHYANLLYKAYGENSYNDIGIVGKMENLYIMLRDETFGLTADELDLLKALEANRTLSDEKLKEKYGLANLKEGETSIDGLVLFLRELLGDEYNEEGELVNSRFDYDILLSDEKDEDGMSEHDRLIQDYFVSWLYARIVAISDASVRTELNFEKTLTDADGVEKDNKTNIDALEKTIDKKISDALTGTKGAIKSVTDGVYDLEVVYPSLDELVDDIVEIIEKADPAKNSKNPVKYASPDTLREDVEAYIKAAYYDAAVAAMAETQVYYTEINDAKLVPSTAVLNIMNVLYQSNTTIASVVEDVAEEIIAAIEAIDQEATSTYYADVYALIVENETVVNALDIIAKALEANYGDVTNELQNAFVEIISAKLPSFTVPTGAFHYKTAEGLTDEQIAAVDQIFADASAALQNASVFDLSAEELETLINETVASIEAIADQYVYDEDQVLRDDVVALAAIGQYNGYTAKLNVTGTNYYFDNQIGAMDAAVQAAVANMVEEIRAELPENADMGTVYDKIMETMADPANGIKALTEEFAALVTYYPTTNGSISDDVLSYYYYCLISSFSEYAIPTDKKPSKIGKLTNSGCITNVYNNFSEKIDELLALARTQTERGQLVDYAISSVLTAEEFDKLINDEFDHVVDRKFAKEEDREEVVPALRSYFYQFYYAKVLDKLNANDMVEFSVGEVYSDVYEASRMLLDQMTYYATALAGMTEKDVDSLIRTGGSQLVVEDDEDPSKYLSDDGRIVAVSYGSWNEETGCYEKYKTFILNYNNFSVSVNYPQADGVAAEESVMYTIPAYGYVVVYHTAD